MTTNAHILTIASHLGQMRALLCAIPESAAREQLIALADGMTDEIFCAQTDVADMGKQIAELNRQLYEPVVQAQMGKRCRYIDADVLNSKGVYTPEEFDKMLCKACEGTGKTLGTFLRKYEKLGYLDFHGESKRKILEHLQECYPSMRRYKYNNFIAYF